jgi:uncharacterized protein (TIGR02594 family)
MFPPWLSRAANERDVEEVPGEQSNARIIEYHAETTLKATSDEVAWCSAFVCWCLERCGIPSTRSAAARSWLDWGIPIDKGIQGAIVILSRGSNPAQGHVGFFWSEDLDQVYILGGNQDNKVSVKGYDKKRVLGYRVPEDDYWVGNNENPSCNTRYS